MILQRIDAQQQHINWLHNQLMPMLEKLPDAIQSQIGFHKPSKAP